MLYTISQYKKGEKVNVKKEKVDMSVVIGWYHSYSVNILHVILLQL